MHVADGLINGIAIAGGYAITAGLTALSLRKIQAEEDYRSVIPKASLLTAAFFIASSIFIPTQPPVHLVLGGLLGIMLGWYAFPAILIGLFFQVFIGHGGLTTLGINGVIMGIPALIAHFTYRPLSKGNPFFAGLIAGGIAYALSYSLYLLIIFNFLPQNTPISAENQLRLTTALFAINAIALALDAIITGLIVNYLNRVRPALLQL